MVQRKHHSKPNRKSRLLNETNAVRTNVMPFLVTYRPNFPIIRETINKQLHKSNINVSD